MKTFTLGKQTVFYLRASGEGEILFFDKNFIKFKFDLMHGQTIEFEKDYFGHFGVYFDDLSIKSVVEELDVRGANFELLWVNRK